MGQSPYLGNIPNVDCPLLQGDFDKLKMPTLPQFVATTVSGTFGLCLIMASRNSNLG